MPNLSSTSRSQSDRDRRGARRGAILDAALAHFARYGYRRASMNELARDAGISRAALYLHFDSKESLFRSLVERLHHDGLERARAAAGGDGGIETRLRAVVEARALPTLDLLRHSPHAGEFLDENSRLCGDVSARAAEGYGRVLLRLLRDADRAGEIDLAAGGLTAEGASELVLDAVEGLKTRGLAGMSPEQLRRRLGDLVRILVRGLGGAEREGRPGRSGGPTRPARSRTAGRRAGERRPA
jgi:AcrR family transcriptional regulator